MSWWTDTFEPIIMIWQVLEKTWFFVLPIAFYIVFKTIWMNFIQDKYSKTVKYILLELIPPDDIEKSPMPMETLFDGLHATRITFNAFDELALGASNPSFSLEIVGDSGKAHLYIYTPESFRNVIESNIYAHYPYAEIREVLDYTKSVPKTIPDKEWNVWGAELELVKPDPYPILTYRYFKEDITGKMIDPLASLIEAAGKLGPSQKIWFQIIISPEKETWTNTGRELVEELTGRKNPPSSVWEQLKTDFNDMIKGIIAGIFSPEKIKEIGASNENSQVEEIPLESKLTPGEKKVIEAIENMIGKNVFKTKLRFVYVGRRENFDKSNITNFMGAIKQFQDQNLNGLKPNDESKTYANYLLKKQRLLYRQRKIFNRYKSRSNHPYSRRFIFNTEELATLFHLPDMAIVNATPAIQKVESKQGSAPPNLPIASSGP